MGIEWEGGLGHVVGCLLLLIQVGVGCHLTAITGYSLGVLGCGSYALVYLFFNDVK